MPVLTALGASCLCSCGTSPSVMVVEPDNLVNATTCAASTMDSASITNLPTFGSCSSSANPVVSAATAAAGGALTPMPCIPDLASPWAPGSLVVFLGDGGALDASSTLSCIWGGVISIVSPGQVTVQVA